MRLACAFMALAFGAGATGLLRAQSDPPSALIEWSAQRPLRKSDFKGVATASNAVGARSLISIEASWACDAHSLNATVRAVFDPAQSTWAASAAGIGTAVQSRFTQPGDQSQLLEHEQIHFDIAELFARKIRAHLAASTDACTRPGGTLPFGAIVQDYQAELDEEQARYDRQTRFGTDPRVQWDWTSRTRKSLASTP